MAGKAMTKKVAGSKVLGILDQPPEGALLRVRNVSQIGLAIPSSDRASDIFLGVQAELALAPNWAKNRSLRRGVENGHLEVGWVDADYDPRTIPDPDAAPSDAQVETTFDRSYAMEIALGPSDDALRLVGITVQTPDTGEPDVRFMKGRMWKVLKLAQWIEEQVQARAKVLAALDRRLQEIRAM